MKNRDFLFIYFIAVVVITTAGLLQRSAGYMDAEYYASIGAGIREGDGFNQNFLWNYLDDPTGIPHPSNTYWMPLASILSTISVTFSLFGHKTTLWVINILFSSLIPVLTAWITFGFTKRRGDAWFTGLLAIFSGFYLLYYAIPETFAASMVFGSLLIILLTDNGDAETLKINPPVRWGLIGIIAGLLHMTRAEGILWFAIAAGYLVFLTIKNRDFKKKLVSAGFLITGYLVVSGAWYLRNMIYWDQFFPPGSSRTLWLINYDQTFAFPSNQLTFQNWWNQGIPSIIAFRRDALWMNLKSMLAVQGGILLLPFIITGWWVKKKDPRMVITVLYYGLIFVLMTVVFPFAGSRGGFIHSAAGVQPFFWAMVPIGLDRLLRWGERKRGWHLDEARRVFQIGLVLIMVLLTSVIFYQRVIEKQNGISAWQVEENHYYTVYEELVANQNLKPDSVVMVKNPPGWFFVTGLPVIVIPDADELTMRNVSLQFNADILILEKDHVNGLNSLYNTSSSRTGLVKIMEIGTTQIYSILPGN
jgi:hypothetical protein